MLPSIIELFYVKPELIPSTTRYKALIQISTYASIAICVTLKISILNTFDHTVLNPRWSGDWIVRYNCGMGHILAIPITLELICDIGFRWEDFQIIFDQDKYDLYNLKNIKHQLSWSHTISKSQWNQYFILYSFLFNFCSMVIPVHLCLSFSSSIIK